MHLYGRWCQIHQSAGLAGNSGGVKVAEHASSIWPSGYLAVFGPIARPASVEVSNTDRALADGIGSLLDHLPSIERIEIDRYPRAEFLMDKYKRIDVRCLQRNVAVATKVKEKDIRPADLPKFEKVGDKYTIRLGRRD